MRRSIKAAFLLLVFSVCALGVVFSPKGTAKEREPETQLLPVNNRAPHRVWLRA
jgi:hypothetical protein